jgi:hypothetical protein
MERGVGRAKWLLINLMKSLWTISRQFMKVSGNLTKDPVLEK